MILWRRFTRSMRLAPRQQDRRSGSRTPSFGSAESGKGGKIRLNAWGIVVRPRGLEVYAGPCVERHDGFLAEGAWAGVFSSKGILSSTFRCGSGAILDEGRTLLFGPSHSVEHIYCFAGRGYLAASNSIHMAIALSRRAEPHDLEAAQSSSATILAGYHHYDRILYTTTTGTMLRLAFGTWAIDHMTLSISETLPATKAVSDFSDFAGYRGLLVRTLQSLVDNARSPLRRAPYGDIITTCSSGYDLPACAALAKELGCKEAVTMRTARGGANDSGKGVSEALGLICHEYDRLGAVLEKKVEGDQHHRLDAEHIPSKYREFLGSINPPGNSGSATSRSTSEGGSFSPGFTATRSGPKDARAGRRSSAGTTAAPESTNSGSGWDSSMSRFRISGPQTTRPWPRCSMQTRCGPTMCRATMTGRCREGSPRRRACRGGSSASARRPGRS